MDKLQRSILTAPKGDEADDALRYEIRRFKAIGGIITLSCWLSLDERSRELVEEAVLEDEHAILEAVASDEVSAAVDDIVGRLSQCRA